ncbi:MAG: GspH/FimT family protein [Pseudomonadota bacterium]
MRSSRAFKLVGFIIFIAIISALIAAVIVSISLSGKDLDAVARALRSNIQFAQDLAMTRGSHYGFTGVSTTEYQIFDGAPGTPARNPFTNRNFNVNISPIAFVGAVPTITFLSSGQPNIASNEMITLTDGTGTVKVKVARSTGYVSIVK